MFASEPIALHQSYSFEDAVRDSIAAETASSHLDLGPIDTMDPATLKREYDAFFGASPLNSLSPSPSPSRPNSPDAKARERLLDEFLGISPPSTPPQSPPQPPRPPRSASHALEMQPPPATSPPPPEIQPSAAQGTQVNSKKRRCRKKGREKRTLKRKAESDVQDKNATPHPRSLKRIKGAESTQTSYDTRNIPSASTGFVARRETDGGRVAGVETLLQDPFFRLIKHQEGCVAAPVRLDPALTSAYAPK